MTCFNMAGANDAQGFAVDFRMGHQQVLGEVPVIALGQHGQLDLHGGG